MVVVGNDRYREEDARRLGLDGGKTVTANTRVSRTSEAPAGLARTADADTSAEGDTADTNTGGDDTAVNTGSEDGADGAPAKSAPKGDWVDYALEHGKTAEDLEGKTKEQIIDLFTTGD